MHTQVISNWFLYVFWLQIDNAMLLDKVGEVNHVYFNSSSDILLNSTDFMDMDFSDTLFSQLNQSTFSFPNPKEFCKYYHECIYLYNYGDYKLWHTTCMICIKNMYLIIPPIFSNFLRQIHAFKICLWDISNDVYFPPSLFFILQNFIYFFFHLI